MAVVGFADQRASASSGDTALTLGLADYLENCLRNEGVLLIDRDTVMPVLAERRLQRLIGGRVSDKVMPALPGVDIAVRGWVELAVNQGLLVGIDFIRTTDGGLERRVTRRCGGESGIADALAQIAAELRGGTEPLAEPTVARSRPEGFTESPEAAMWFYRGLQSLAERDYAMAIACLDEAVLCDYSFYIAEAWLVRALRRAGMPEFAQGLLDEANTYKLDKLEQLLASDKQLSADSTRVVAVMATNPQAQSIARRLEIAFAAHENLTVLSADGVVTSSQERDLKLSGEFSSLPAVVDRWLFADVFVQVDPIVVKAYEVRSGRLLGAVHPSETDDLARLMKASAGTASARSAASFDPASTFEVDPTGTVFYDQARRELGDGKNWETSSKSTETVGRVTRTAHLLQRVIAKPNSLSAYWPIARHDRPFATRGACERMLRLLEHHDDHPDAAAWLSVVLYTQYERDMHFDYKPVGFKCHFEPTVAERFAPLLKRYPGSSVVAVIDYTFAQEHLSAGRHKEALQLLIQLDEQWDSLVFPGVAGLAEYMRANLLYHAAYSSFVLGRLDDARQFFDRCQQVVENANGGNITRLGRMQIAVRDESLAWTFSTKSSHSHGAYLEQRLDDLPSLNPMIETLGRYIADAEAGKIEAGPIDGSVELFISAVAEIDPDKRFAQHLASVEKALDPTHTTHKIQERLVHQLAWLRLRCQTPQQHEQIDDLVDRALRASNSSFQKWRLMGLAGRLDQAYELASQDLRQAGAAHAAGLPLHFFQLVSLTKSPVETARTFEQTLDQMLSEAEQAGEQGDGAERYCHYFFTETLAPYLIENGRPGAAERHLTHVVEDDSLPRQYRLRAEFRRALAVSRQGRVAEAAASLSRIADEAAVLSGDDVTAWNRQYKPASRRWLRSVPPYRTRNLVYFARYELSRLRLYGGQPEAIHPPVASANLTPLPGGRHDQATMYAMYLGLGQRSYYRDYYGRSMWKNEALRRAVEMGDAAVPMLHRITGTVQTLDDRTLDHWLSAPYAAYFALAWNDAEDQLPAQLLVDRMMWSDRCEINLNSARGVRKVMPMRDAPVAFVLASAMKGGSASSAIEGLERVDAHALNPGTRRRLGELLEHPSASVRQNAAMLLSDYHGIRLPVDTEGEPTDKGITALLDFLSHDKPHQQDTLAKPAKPNQNSGPLRIIESQFDASGSLLITAEPGPVARVWDLTTAGSIPLLLNHDKAAYVSCARLADDKRFAATFASDHVLRFWDLDDSHQPSKTWRLQSEPLDFGISPDGSRIAVNVFGKCSVYDTESGQVVWERVMPASAAIHAEFSSDGSLLMTECRRNGAIAVLNSATGELLHELVGYDIDVTDALFLNDKEGILVDYRLMARRVDFASGEETRRFDGLAHSPTSVAVSPDGKLLLTSLCHGGLAVWLLDGGKTAEPLAVNPGHHGDPLAIGWTPAGLARVIYADGTLLECSSDLTTVTRKYLGSVQGQIVLTEPGH